MKCTKLKSRFYYDVQRNPINMASVISVSYVNTTMPKKNNPFNDICICIALKPFTDI